MANEPRREVYIRDGEAEVPQTSTEGGVSEVRKHYILRADGGVLSGFYSGERDDNRVQGTPDEQGQNQTSSSQEGQS